MSEPCIFIVDDDEDIRSSLARALRTRGYDTRVFASAGEYLDSDVLGMPGCLILDFGMPGMSGLELQQTLVSNGRAIPIIFITGHGGVPEAVQAMKYGAVDFLEKPFRQDTLLLRIEAALEQDEQARRLRDRSRAAQERFSRLTDRESEIAGCLVNDPSRSSSKEVARRLGISPRTVDHHRARILEKMDVSSVAELIDLSNSAGLFPRD